MAIPPNIAYSIFPGTGVIFDFRILRNHRQATNSAHAAHWKLVFDTEFAALLNNKTWSLIPYSPDMVVIPNKWVFDVQVIPSLDMSIKPTIDRFRAHLVARGDTQEKSINYDEVYAPVVRFL